MLKRRSNRALSAITGLGILILLISGILGIVGCSKEEEPAGTAEKMGKQIDEAAASIRTQVEETAQAAREQATKAKAELGAAIEAKGKEMQEKAEESSQ
jgi:hypothetical protein